MSRLFLVTIGCIVLTICLLKTGTIDFDDSVRGALRTTMWNVKYLYQSFGQTARRFTHRTDNETVVVQFEGVEPEKPTEEPEVTPPVKEEKKKPTTPKEALQSFSSQMKQVVKDLGTQFLQREMLNVINTGDFNRDRFQQTFVVDSTESLAEERQDFAIDVYKSRQTDFVKENSGNRLGFAAKAQAKLFKERIVLKEHALRIGIAFNGNGYRGMLLSLGYAAGLADMGVWDAATHVSAVSGATWFLSVLMAIVQKNKGIEAPQACAKVLEHFLTKIQNRSFSLTDKKALEDFLSQGSLESFVMSVLAPKVFFEQPIRSVDFYGGLLGTTLLSGIVDNPHQRCLSDEWELIYDLRKGLWPMPLRAAVALVENEYRWYEFNPLEVRDTVLNMAVWTSGFGRKYAQGMSEIVAPETIQKIADSPDEKKKVVEKIKLIGEYGPEERLEFLMGLWGSAYTTNIKELKDAIQNKIQGRQKQQGWEKVVANLKDRLTLAVLKKLEKDIVTDQQRTSPAQVNNFLRQCGADHCPSPKSTPPYDPRPVSSEMSETDYTTMVDASLNFDMSLPVLYQERRNFDVIIVGDAASDMELTRHYTQFFAYLKDKKEIEYERTDNKKDPTLCIWKPKEGKKAPVIIGINFKKDPKIIEQAKRDPALKKLIDEYGVNNFDHAAALNGYASNFGFNYSAEQCKQLYGIGSLNMRVHEKVILDELRELLKRKKPASDEGPIFGGDDEDIPVHEPVHEPEEPEKPQEPEEHKEEAPSSGTLLMEALADLAQKLGELKAALR